MMFFILETVCCVEKPLYWPHLHGKLPRMFFSLATSLSEPQSRGPLCIVAFASFRNANICPDLLCMRLVLVCQSEGFSKQKCASNSSTM